MKIWSINPKNEEKIEEYEVMSENTIEDILNNAQKRFQNWKNEPIQRKKELFRKLADILRQNKERYSALMTNEMGKPISQAQGEVEKCAWTCEVYADNVDTWLQEEVVQADGIEHKVVFQPLGVILSIMPWNFPFWQAFRFAIPAIISGNVSILKHSNNVPGCAMAIEEAFSLAGFPKGVFTTIISDHKTVSKLIESDKIQGVSLTGSTEAGSKIAELAGKNLKKVVLELGGSDPFIIFEDADIEAAVKGAVYGRTQNNGQSCIAAKRFIVQDTVVEEFAKKFAEEVSNLKIGDPSDSSVQIGPLANQGEYTTAKDQLQDAINNGAKVLVQNKDNGNKGYFFTPTVVTNTTPEMRIVKEEVFSPIAPVISFSNEAEAIRMANNTEFGLGGAVWTKDLEKGKRVALQLQAGSVFVNSIVKSDPRMPFGGVKKSGTGRELSKYGLREFVNVKGLNVYK